MTQETEEQIRACIKILDRNRHSPLVQRVVKGETQFQREVVDFYGINPKRGGHLLAITLSMGTIRTKYTTRKYKNR